VRSGDIEFERDVRVDAGERIDSAWFEQHDDWRREFVWIDVGRVYIERHSQSVIVDSASVFDDRRLDLCVSSCDDADRGVAGLDQRCERVADDSVGGGNCRSVTLGSIDFGR
jgi:hypothetical protein